MRSSICSSAALVDPATGALIEFFGEDWSPAPGAEGALREPGHQFEWVWLLHEYVRAAHDDSVAPYAERLFAFGTQFGIDAGRYRRVFDGVDASGALVAGTKTALAADRIPQGLRGACRMAQ